MQIRHTNFFWQVICTIEWVFSILESEFHNPSTSDELGLYLLCICSFQIKHSLFKEGGYFMWLENIMNAPRLTGQSVIAGKEDALGLSCLQVLGISSDIVMGSHPQTGMSYLLMKLTLRKLGSSKLHLKTCQFIMLDVRRIISSICHYCPIWFLFIPPQKGKTTVSQLTQHM